MKKLLIGLFALVMLALGTAAFAAISGIGSVAAQVTYNVANIAKLVTAGAYVGGMALAILGLVKIKAHKDNPTQVALSTGIVLLFVGSGLVFVPTVFKVGGGTLFGQSGYVAGVSGITSFGASKPT